MAVNAAVRKQQLANEIRELGRQEAQAAEKKRREDNYAEFLKRPADWVIGRAHCEHKFKDNGWHHPAGEQMPSSVEVRGNMGHTYYPTAWITSATNTYFHNVWDGAQRERFQKKLNDLVQQEIKEIMSNPYQVLEIMGLQSDHYLLSKEYPESKISSMKKEITQERWKVLDQFTDKQLSSVPRLSHSEHILQEYLKAKRKKLYTRRTANQD